MIFLQPCFSDMPIAHRTLPLRPGSLHVPQSRLLLVPHLMLPLRPRLRSFFRSWTPVSRWRLLMARCLRACRCRHWRFPCRYLRMSCRPLVWHRLLSSRQLSSLLLRILLLCLGPAHRPPPMICSRLTLTLRCLRRAVAAVPPAGSPIVAHFEPVNLSVSQDSRLSSVLLSPNRVRQDFDVTQEDQYPLFDASPVSDGQLSPVSPATSRGSSPIGSEWDAESFHNAGVSLATSASLSITHRTADLKILKPHRLLSRQWSSSTRIPPCWNSLRQPIGIGFPSLRQILRPSWLLL